MAKLTKTQKVGAGLGIFGLITAIVAAIRAKAAPPPPPPPPGLATLWGMVTDAITGEPIKGIEITLNGWSYTTGTDGRYEFAEIEPGTYSLIFSDPLGRYEPLTI